jgi:hypothetical protein
MLIQSRQQIPALGAQDVELTTPPLTRQFELDVKHTPPSATQAFLGRAGQVVTVPLQVKLVEPTVHGVVVQVNT